MKDLPSELMLDVDKLRLGMYVYLDLNWMEHPFPLNRFTITSAEQIEQIQGLGLKRVKVLPPRSAAGVFDAASEDWSASQLPLASAEANPATRAPGKSLLAPARAPQRMALDAQNAALARCEKAFAEASAAWKQIATSSQRDPNGAAQRTAALVQGFVTELSSARETSIRLLSEIAGDGAALHALNVTVVSMLLGRAMKVDEATLTDIGVGALLHDIGKLALPDRLRWRSDRFSAFEERTYREHVQLGQQAVTKMGLGPGVQAVIAQHHETVDGKGYPKGVGGAQISLAAKIVALVNTYDNLCNPGNPSSAMTPHEALSLMFAQLKPRFDMGSLTAFIRLMGVYPPGSVVQLSDERFALVVSVNAARPLKPTVLVFDPKVPRDEALLMDLQADPVLGIRRSLHTHQLSRPALEYLTPRKRMSYFFERNSEVTEQGQMRSAWVMDSSVSTTDSKAES